jgi:putative tryptophan/tyrosine transport system substrate-binding protein
MPLLSFGGGNEAARADHASGQRGGNLAAHGARAADERLRTVGILLGSRDNPEMRRLLGAFMESFKALGWTENRNVRFDVRWSGTGLGNPENNTIQAQDLVRQQPDVIFAAPSNVVIALQKQTRTIPIVFANVSDPIAQGVVDNLARPTGNLTGFSNLEHGHRRLKYFCSAIRPHFAGRKSLL